MPTYAVRCAKCEAIIISSYVQQSAKLRLNVRCPFCQQENLTIEGRTAPHGDPSVIAKDLKKMKVSEMKAYRARVFEAYDAIIADYNDRKERVNDAVEALLDVERKRIAEYKKKQEEERTREKGFKPEFVGKRTETKEGVPARAVVEMLTELLDFHLMMKKMSAEDVGHMKVKLATLSGCNEVAKKLGLKGGF